MAKFLHLPKAKRFTYKPMYYNEQAELRKERETAIIKELEAEKKGNRVRFTKDELENHIQLTRKAKKKSNVRLLVILVILILLSYYMFYN